MNRLDPLRLPISGTRLIEASAGTGKTHAIATIYLRLVLGLYGETPRRVQEILVVTFTRAATEELRGRVRLRLFDALDVLERVHGGEGEWLGADTPRGKTLDNDLRQMLNQIDTENRVEESITRLRLELATIDDAAIFTIHGFCQRALQEQAFDSGEAFEFELVQDDSVRELQAVQDHWRACYYPCAVLAAFAHHFFGTPKELHSTLRPLLRPGVTLAYDPIPAEDLPTVRAAVAMAWKRDGAALTQQIHDFKALSRGKYKAEAVNLAASLLRDWCDTDCLRLPTDGGLFVRHNLDANITPAQWKKGVRFPGHPLVDAITEYADACARIKQSMLAEAAKDVQARLEAARRQSGVAAFDDLIVRLHRALTAPSGRRLAEALAQRYPVAMIDEFQDTDPLQYEIFSKIYGAAPNNGSLLLIGDPKQAIYSFRGADIFAYMRAREDAGAAHRYSLDTNWRSVTPLVEGLNTLFTRRTAPFLYADAIDFQRVTAKGGADTNRLRENGIEPVPLEFWLLPEGEWGALSKADAEEMILRQMARRIAALLVQGVRDGKPLAPRDIAVLVRTNNQGAAAQRALRELGIGSAMAGTDSVYATEEALALRDVLAAIAEPTNDRALRRALVSPLWRHHAAFLVALGEDLADYEKLLQDLHDWRTAWQAGGFMPMFRRFMHASGVAADLLSMPDGERRLTNLVQLSELLQEASREHPSPDSLVRWLDDNIAEPDASADEQQLRLESDEDLVQVLTLHRSKGLEYPVVFLPFLYDTRSVDPKKEFPRFHDDQRTLVVDLATSEEGVKRAEYERLAEDMRLVYVGLTRAKDYCIVPWGRVNRTDRSALAYLLHGPDGLKQVDDLSTHTKALMHADIVAEIGAVADRHPNEIRAIAIEDAISGNVPAPSGLDNPKKDLAARDVTRSVQRAYVTTSYSGLVEGVYDEPRDLGIRGEAEIAAMPMVATGPLSPYSLPGGTAIGHLFHDLLEGIDYATAQGERLRGIVSHAIARRAMPAGWREVVATMIENTLDAVLDAASGFTLRSLGSTQRRNEMQFWYPLHCLRADALESQLPGLGDAIETPRLTFSPVNGFLQGFIDLVFEHGGRWYVADWKTNKLGPDASWYSRDHLARAIAHSRYDLQYTLYTVALHRHLRRSLGAQYEPEKHLGGVYYLFLRGIRPGDVAQSGIWHVPADIPRIEALDALFRDGK